VHGLSPFGEFVTLEYDGLPVPAPTAVNGHWEIRLGGLVSPGWRPPVFQAGGRVFSRRAG
jgi:hypothetical protein